MPTSSRRLHQLRSESLPATCNNARLRPCPSNPRCMGIPRPAHGRPLCSILARLRGSHAPVLPAHPADHIPVSGIRLHGVAKRDPSSCMRYVAFHDALAAPSHALRHDAPKRRPICHAVAFSSLFACQPPVCPRLWENESGTHPLGLLLLFSCRESWKTSAAPLGPRATRRSLLPTRLRAAP